MMRPLGISSGDPGGVGPEVSLRACAAVRDGRPLVIYGDPVALQADAAALGIPPELLRPLEKGRELEAEPGVVGLVDTGERWTPAARTHAPTADGGRAQLASLDAALEAALAGRLGGLVTAPMSKAAVNLGGASFVGHTEHMARAAGLADDDVTMMFLGPRLKVALVTTHLAVADLPRAITARRVERTVRHLADALTRLLQHDGTPGASRSRLLVTGLNPHAGEGGLFGSEEPRAIVPVIEALRDESPFGAAGTWLSLEGPVPAETAFRMAASGEVAGVVAMMHDQATIASKLLDWTRAVNVTWGLPFVRTSVDHGVAYDAAAAGDVDPRGMQSALELAQRLTRQQ